MVTHNGVNYREGIGIALEKLKAVVYLLRRTEKAAVNALKIQLQLFVVLQGGSEIIGEVAQLDLAQAARVRRQNSGGNRADLHPHSGKNGDYDSERAAAEA